MTASLAPALVVPPLCEGALDAPALVTADQTLTYADLARRVEERRVRLGGTRRLVLLEASTDVETVVTFLAALSGRHPVLLAAPGDTARRADLLTHDPDVAAYLPRTITIRDGRVGGEGRSGEEYAVITPDGFLPLPLHVREELQPGTLVRFHRNEDGDYLLVTEEGHHG